MSEDQYVNTATVWASTVVSLASGRGCWGCSAGGSYTQECHLNYPSCSASDRFTDPRNGLYGSAILGPVIGRVNEVIYLTGHERV